MRCPNRIIGQHSISIRQAAQRSFYREEQIVDPFNLANSSPSADSSTNAVRSQNGDRIVPDNGHGGGNPIVTKEQNRNQALATFRYIRRSGGGRLTTQETPKSVPYEDAYYADYDISKDGKHWFHLIGERCFWDCPPLIILPSSGK